MPRGGDGRAILRVRCTFEAAMVYLRDLPVVVAGHELSGIQWCIAAWGSYLVLPPWWKDSSDPVYSLAALNLAFYVYSCLHLGLATAMFLRSLYPQVLVVWVLFYFVVFLVWQWGRHRGLQVMLAANGREVLQVMLAGASGHGKALNIDRCTRYMSWLPAYDRRDIMTAYTLLLYVAQNEGGSIPNAVHPHAVAASIYYAALLMPSPGDQPNGRSVREWLAAIGVKVYGGSLSQLAQSSKGSFLDAAEDGSYEDEAELAEWLDKPAPMDAAPEESPSLHISVESAAGAGTRQNPSVVQPMTPEAHESNTASATNFRSSLLTSHLQHLGWDFIPGMRDAVRTPAGSFWVAPRGYREVSRSVHGTAKAHDLPALDQDFSLTVLFWLMAVTACIMGIVFELTRGDFLPVSTCGANLPINATAAERAAEGGYPQGFCQARSVLNAALFYAMPALYFLIIKLPYDIKEGAAHWPALALPQTARMETCIAFIVLAVLVYIVVAHSFTARWESHMGPQHMDAIAYPIAAFAAIILFLYLAHLIAVHALVAAWRHRSWRVASAWTGRRVEAPVRIL